MEPCKATITLPDDSKLTFEGPASFVEEQLERYTNKSSPIIPAADPVGGSGYVTPPGTLEKQLIVQKNPSGHHEIATVLAFALTESGMSEFTEADIRRAYLRAEVRPPKFVSQALRDAKSKFDYIATGSKRGMYKLTNHGDRVVRFDLPRADR